MRVFYLIILLNIGCTAGLDKEHPLYNDTKVVKTENHERILGTKLFAVIPDSFKYDKNSNGYSTSTQNIKFRQPLGNTWSNYAKQSDILQRETIPLYGYKGNFIELEDTERNKTTMLIQFGSDDFFYSITAETSNEVRNGRNQMLEILRSIYYDKDYDLDELETLDYTFDISTISHDFIVFGKANKTCTLSENSEGHFLMLTSSLFITENNLDKKILKSLSEQKMRGIQFTNPEIENSSVGDYRLKILKSETKFQSKTGIYAHAIICDDERIIELIAYGYENAEELSAMIDTILESLKFR